MDKPFLYISIHAFIVRDDKSLLLVRRAAHDSRPGVWETPGGGLEITEDPADGAVREVFEETGLHIEVEKIILAKNFYYPEKNKQALRIAYLCKLSDNAGEIALSEDHSAHQWVNASDLPDYLADFTEIVVKQLIKEGLL